jgi:mRNA interferase RelE/StbE
LVYQIKYHKSVREDLNGIDNLSKTRIKRAIETRLSVEPIKFGEPLKGDLRGFKKLSIGDYRIVYKVIEEEIFILFVSNPF